MSSSVDVLRAIERQLARLIARIVCEGPGAVLGKPLFVAGRAGIVQHTVGRVLAHYQRGTVGHLGRAHALEQLRLRRDHVDDALGQEALAAVQIDHGTGTG